MVTAPPDSPVPAPRGTTGMRCWGASLMTAATSPAGGALVGAGRKYDSVGRCALDRGVTLEDAKVGGAVNHVLATDDPSQLFQHRCLQRHYASGASCSGLRSNASKRRVVAPGKPGASIASAPATRRLSHRAHSPSLGIRSGRSKIASWIRLWGDSWIVYQTESPSSVTRWWLSSTRRLTGSFIGLASAAARSRAASDSIVTRTSLNSNR